MTRYVLLELIKSLVVTLAAMTVLMILVGVAREGVRQGLGPGPIMRMIPFVLPEALRYSVPATLLLATCSVFGRMSADNEVVAIKSLGISPMVLMTPCLALAFLMSLVAVWLNDLAVSWGRRGVQRVVIESVEQIAYGMLRTQRSYGNQRFSITVKRVAGDTLVRPTVTFHGTDDSPTIMLTAREAHLRRNPEENTLSIFLTDGTIDVEGKLSMSFPDTIERVIPLTDATRKSSASDSPSQVSLRRISPESERQREEVQRLKQSMAVRAAYEMFTGDLGALTDDPWRRRHDLLSQATYRLSRLQAEPWRRWANGFACLFFVIVGAPLSIRRRSANLFTTFAACFLPILLIYYPLLIFGVDRAKDGALPPYVVWLANVALLVWGFGLLRRVIRY